MTDENIYFLRSKVRTKSQNQTPSCLYNLIETEEKGIIVFGELLPDCNKDDYWIPETWPKGKSQRGYCCGLYALDIGLKHSIGNSNQETPPARKDKKNDVVSLRQIAKEKKLSAFGEIFNVQSLKELTDYFKFPNCEILKPKTTDQHEYTQAICNKLKNDFLVVTSLDLKNSFPGESKGLGTHWALIFGYLYHKGQCYFLATQWGRYFLFSAQNLFNSNKNLPSDNPRRYPYHIYYKDEYDEYFRKKKRKENLSDLKVRYAVGDTLDQFRFSLFCIPVHDAAASIDLTKLNIPEKADLNNC